MLRRGRGRSARRTGSSIRWRYSAVRRTVTGVCAHYLRRSRRLHLGDNALIAQLFVVGTVGWASVRHDPERAASHARARMGRDAGAMRRARDAAMEVASELDLAVADARALHNSNKLALCVPPRTSWPGWLSPGSRSFRQTRDRPSACRGRSSRGEFEPRVEPRVYQRHGFAVTLWTYYEQTRQQVLPADYAKALERLHAGMAKIDVTVPHFLDRVAEAQQLAESRDRTPELGDSDRKLLSRTLRSQRRAISQRLSAEQLVHGEPHAGNLLSTRAGRCS